MKILSYQDFGATLIDEVVTSARIENAVARVAGGHVEVGPLGAGPGDAASVVAKGTLAAPEVHAVDPEADGTRRFVVTIPVELHLSVKVAGTLHRFESSVRVDLHLAIRTAANPLSLVIDIAPPDSSDMVVEVRASGVTARVLGRLGNIDAKIRKEVVAFINARLDDPDARAATIIDVEQTVESIWQS